MLDINHIINEEAHYNIDPEGHMYDLDHWSPITAAKLALDEGIGELSEAHWHVMTTEQNR